MQQVQFTEEEDAAAKVATVAQKDGSNDGSVGHLGMLEYWKNLLVLENNWYAEILLELPVRLLWL